MQLPKTKDELKKLYIDNVVAIDSSLDVSQYSDYDNKGNVISALASDVELDTYNSYNDLIPQNASPFGVNLQLSAKKLTIQLPATQAQLNVNILNSNITPQPPTGVVVVFNINVGTILTSSVDSNVYNVINNYNNNLNYVVVDNSNNNLLYCLSQNSGSGNGQNNGSLLTLSPPITSVDGNYTLNALSVSLSVGGSNQESEASAQERLLNAYGNPKSGGTKATDYKDLLLSNIVNNLPISDVIPLGANNLNYQSSTPINVALYLLSGDPITDSVLNQGLLPSTKEQLFSRTSLPSTIATGSSIVSNNQAIGVFSTVSTVITQILTNNTSLSTSLFLISVSLKGSYSLDTNVTLSNGVNLKISQLIQREVRRAICSQPYGANLTINNSTGAYKSSYLPISSIEQQLDSALGTGSKTGSLGWFITNREVLVYNGNTYGYQSSIQLSLAIPNQVYSASSTQNNSLGWIYDVSTVGNIYNNISVISGLTSS